MTKKEFNEKEDYQLRVAHYRDIQPQEQAPGIDKPQGVAIRTVIGTKEGALNFAMRVVEFEPGASLSLHTHPWEHEQYVLAGQGAVLREDGETPISEGVTVFIPPNEVHALANRGDDILRLLCCIPLTEATRHLA